MVFLCSGMYDSSLVLDVSIFFFICWGRVPFLDRVNSGKFWELSITLSNVILVSLSPAFSSHPSFVSKHTLNLAKVGVFYSKVRTRKAMFGSSVHKLRHELDDMCVYRHKYPKLTSSHLTCLLGSSLIYRHRGHGDIGNFTTILPKQRDSFYLQPCPAVSLLPRLSFHWRPLWKYSSVRQYFSDLNWLSLKQKMKGFSLTQRRYLKDTCFHTCD